MGDFEFSEKVSLALVLGLNADLKSAPSAAAKLRNKFAHRLDMEVSQEDVKNLTATLTPTAKQKFQYLLRESRRNCRNCPMKRCPSFARRFN